jgi:L-ascorbate metabolism protein UlaG (beta-lactamase superfamily)
MTRRRFLAAALLPFTALAGGAGTWAVTRANPYYRGPPTDHFDGKRFFIAGRDTDKSLKDLLAWSLGGGKAPWPSSAPVVPDKPPERASGLRVTLIGHASVLIQVHGVNILVDPVYGERASPVRFAGPRRITAPGIAFDDLPPIDCVLVTHNHYDHLCTETLARLGAGHAPRVITPLGNDAIIGPAMTGGTVEAHDWHARVRLSDAVSVTLEPSYHWSARGLYDRRMALWSGFAIQAPPGLVYVAGDTAYENGALFRQVRARHGPPRLAILPIGAYEPRWFMVTQHVNPNEAVRIFEDLGAKDAIGVHWGTFRLTDEGRDDPPRALSAALAQAGIEPERFRALEPGEVFAG